MKHACKLFAVLACTALIAACAGEPDDSGGNEGNGGNAAAARPAPVRVAQAEIRRFSPTVPIAGTVISRQEARVSAEVSGRLEHVAEVGTQVEKDEALARIDDTQLRLQVDEQKAVVTREEANLGYLRKQQERLESLAAQNAAARNQLDEVTSQRQVAESELQVARSRLAQLQDQLDRTTIAAPFDGVVSERIATPGELVSEGDAVVRLINAGEREVLARGPLEYLPFIQPGDPIQVSWKGQSHVGNVRSVVGTGDDVSHLFEIRVEVPDSAWAIGQTVQVAMPTADTRQVLAVPRDALVLRREGTTIYVVNGDGTARRVQVNPGSGQGPYVEVNGEVKAGDRVIIRGNERLQPGQPVEVLGG